MKSWMIVDDQVLGLFAMISVGSTDLGFVKELWYTPYPLEIANNDRLISVKVKGVQGVGELADVTMQPHPEGKGLVSNGLLPLLEQHKFQACERHGYFTGYRSIVTFKTLVLEQRNGSEPNRELSGTKDVLLAEVEIPSTEELMDLALKMSASLDACLNDDLPASAKIAAEEQLRRHIAELVSMAFAR